MSLLFWTFFAELLSVYYIIGLTFTIISEKKKKFLNYFTFLVLAEREFVIHFIPIQFNEDSTKFFLFIFCYLKNIKPPWVFTHWVHSFVKSLEFKSDADTCRVDFLILKRDCKSRTNFNFDKFEIWLWGMMCGLIKLMKWINDGFLMTTRVINKDQNDDDDWWLWLNRVLGCISSN